ncbi:tetratricopeptide repeat protein [Ktedonospora formicarum]|uniref:Tetratricopeptide repeat protein n=1 Tax=Ktedonospora formicarum TaxID=2778364 RepID=A0A8J3MR56_9CHLR|nr:tetratricopeptide repeat protein [Ktedonospora formicarum]GHO43318.1 hypothetical protein KSX_14810 [Ktedonospora formicarum]
MEMGNYHQAEMYLKEGLSIARQIEHREWTCVLIINLGLTTSKQGMYDQAEIYLQEGLVLSRQIGIPHMTALALNEFGNLLLSKKKVQKAKSVFTEMLETLPQGGLDLKALAQYGLARVAAEQGDTQNARALGLQSADLLEQIGHGNAEEVRHWLRAIETT